MDLSLNKQQGEIKLTNGYYQKDGSEFVVTSPHTPVPWHNYLHNQEYHTKVSQLLQGESTCLEPFERNITRGSRLFYVRERGTGEIWSPNVICGGNDDSQHGLDKKKDVKHNHYSCIHTLGSSTLLNRNLWCEAEIKVIVPLEGSMEVWQCRIKNTSDEKKEFSLFSAFMPETGGMGVKCWYDEEQETLYSHTFPYHIRYEDKAKYDACRNYVFMFSNYSVNSYECSERRFRGPDGFDPVPVVVRSGNCSNTICEGENPAGVLEQRFALEAGEEREVRIAVGSAQSLEIIAGLKRLWTDEHAAARELQRVEAYWSKHKESIHIETPDAHLDAFINYWLKKQVATMTESHRFSNLSCVRNELQDAIGYSMLDPQKGGQYLLRVAGGQERSGYMRQYRMLNKLQSPAGLALLNHKDALVWLLLCACAIVQQSGSLDLLDEQAGYADSEELHSLYEHLLLAVDYMQADRGSHGLCLMGDGDWTDPINGAGRLGKGESTWTTMAFLYGLRQFIPLVEERGDLTLKDKLVSLAEELAETINRECWDGEWYLAGYDDAGLPFGSKAETEAQIYLNTQTWAIMSGAARGERLLKCLEAMDRLDTDSGPVVIWPSFSKWDEWIGKISIKRQGTTENGSVYCHASLFKAYADLRAGRNGKAYETIMKTLPGSAYNPVERNMQVPIWVPNYYFGLTGSPNFGKSSMNHSTGTAAWILWTVVEGLLGVTATTTGLEIDPQVPRDWNSYKVDRLYAGSRYEIEFTRKNPQGTSPLEIVVDGKPIAGHMLPMEPGSHYHVTVQY